MLVDAPEILVIASEDACAPVDASVVILRKVAQLMSESPQRRNQFSQITVQSGWHMRCGLRFM